MALAAGAVVWWHGFAVQDARPLASKGFRPPFGLGRVTFLCVAKEKSPIERPPPLICPTYVGFLRLTRLSDGTRRRAIHGPAPLTRHPVSRPAQAGSPQRIRGGTNTVPALDQSVREQCPFMLHVQVRLLPDSCQQPVEEAKKRAAYGIGKSAGRPKNLALNNKIKRGASGASFAERLVCCYRLAQICQRSYWMAAAVTSRPAPGP